MSQKTISPPRRRIKHKFSFLTIIIAGLMLEVPISGAMAGIWHRRGANTGQCCASRQCQTPTTPPAAAQCCWQLKYYYHRKWCGRCVLRCGWFLVPCPPTDDFDDADLPPGSIDIADVPDMAGINEKPDLPDVRHLEDK